MNTSTGTEVAIKAVDGVFGNGLSGIATFMEGAVGGWVTFGLIVTMVGIIITVIYGFVHFRKK